MRRFWVLISESFQEKLGVVVNVIGIVVVVDVGASNDN